MLRITIALLLLGVTASAADSPLVALAKRTNRGASKTPVITDANLARSKGRISVASGEAASTPALPPTPTAAPTPAPPATPAATTPQPTRTYGSTSARNIAPQSSARTIDPSSSARSIAPSSGASSSTPQATIRTIAPSSSAQNIQPQAVKPK